MVTYKYRKRRISKKEWERKIRRRRFFITLAVLSLILITNIINCSRQNQNQQIVISDTVGGDSQSLTQDVLADKVEGLSKAIAQLEAEGKIFDVPEQFQGKIITQVKPSSDEKFIALTFDDGPWPETTVQILDILKQNNIKATFFVVGKPLKVYPEIARQIVAEGHTIGNHTWSHGYDRVNAAKAAKEINDTADLIYKITGIKTYYFRPPGGVLKNGLAAYAQKNNYAVMMWSVDSGDSHSYRPDPKKLVNNVLKSAKPGGIVLLHDGGGNRSTTVEALPKIIEKLREQGYKFVTLAELLEIHDKKQEINPVSPLDEEKNSSNHTDKNFQSLPSP